MTATELRDLDSAQSSIQLDSSPDSANPPKFGGYAAVFNTRANIGNPFKWGFIEQIAPGAFARTISNGDVRFLIDHDPSKLVARQSAQDLELREDGTGLYADAHLDMELSYVRDLARNLEKRRITGMSFQFEVEDDAWDVEQVANRDGKLVDVEVRTLKELRCAEVSAVTFPAYQETTAALRAVSMRDDPDPLGRRAELLSKSDSRRSGGSTGDRVTAGSGGSTLLTAHVDLLMGGFAARYGLTV
jgi:HK97 family phage prohead protease